MKTTSTQYIEIKLYTYPIKYSLSRKSHLPVFHSALRPQQPESRHISTEPVNLPGIFIFASPTKG